ncbi:hypothetical protein HDU97_006236 [Phlyctochytrium planicorne]|nr:hypothetical protein HDU97_006236 [Phlyctochytrium planicorne]
MIISTHYSEQLINPVSYSSIPVYSSSIPFPITLFAVTKTFPKTTFTTTWMASSISVTKTIPETLTDTNSDTNPTTFYNFCLDKGNLKLVFRNK